MGRRGGEGIECRCGGMRWETSAVCEAGGFAEGPCRERQAVQCADIVYVTFTAGKVPCGAVLGEASCTQHMLCSDTRALTLMGVCPVPTQAQVLCSPVCLSLALNTIGSRYRSFCVDMLPPLKALVAVLLGAVWEGVLVALAGLDFEAVAGEGAAEAADVDGDGLGDSLCRCLPAVLLARGAEATTDLLTLRVRCSTAGMASNATRTVTATRIQLGSWGKCCLRMLVPFKA